MALVQALHFEASTAFASLQNGHVLTSAGGGSLMNIREIHHTTSATMMNAITALMNRPHRIATSVSGFVGSVASLRTILRAEKSTPPRSKPIGGMRMSVTSELTTVPSAPPIM